MSNSAILGGVSVGGGLPVAIMGSLNVSPESFYPGSVATESDRLLPMAEAMVEAGAAIVDVGAMSTAPYLPNRIDEAEESSRLGRAVELLAGKLGVPISADTTRAAPARVALEAGATIINDVRGLTTDREMAELVAGAGVGLILVASPGPALSSPTGASQTVASGAAPPIPERVVLSCLRERLARARTAGIDVQRIAVDPGIGFFRTRGPLWYEWDCQILARLETLHDLGHPICVGVSRKSFIGAVLGQEDPTHRLPGSLAATALAVLKGAHLIRTHDVAETRQAIRIAEAIRAATPHPSV